MTKTGSESVSQFALNRFKNKRLGSTNNSARFAEKKTPFD